MGTTCSLAAQNKINSASHTISCSTSDENSDIINLIIHFSADASRDSSPIELFQRIESLIENVTGTKRPQAFLVSNKHHKLFRYVRSTRVADGQEVSAHEIGKVKTSFLFQTTNPNPKRESALSNIATPQLSWSVAVFVDSLIQLRSFSMYSLYTIHVFYCS